MTYLPNKRDCEHGRQRGHCPECDLNDALKRIAKLEAALQEILFECPSPKLPYGCSVVEICQAALKEDK